MLSKLKKTLVIGLTVTFLGIAVAACEKEGPAEKAGEKIDQTMEDAKDKASEMGDKVKDAVEEAGDKVEKATD